MTTDIVVPVYNGLHHVRACLSSLRQLTEEPYQLIVVDDGSDAYVAGELRVMLKELWGESDTVRLLVNDENRGYLYSVNRAVAEGGGDLVVLLNSDTLVTPGWLAGLQSCLRSAADIGIACPLSNHANLTRLEVPDGVTFLEAAALVRDLSPATYPDIGLASGFCFIARRSLYEEVGMFDPLYGAGYYEESDLCMRAAEAGYRVVADDTTYIHHHGWGSFQAGGRHEWMRRNRLRFEERWGRAHEYYTQRFLTTRPFADLEQRLAEAVRNRGSRHLTVVRHVGKSHSTRLLQALEDGTTGHDDTFALLPSDEWRSLARDAGPGVGAISRSRRPRVLYLLPGLGAYGGVISVFQLVNRMLLNGFDAQVATYGTVVESIYAEPMHFRPYRFGSRKEMIETLPRYDLVVSTRWDTAYDALLLQALWGCKVASFIQGFEAPHEPAERQRAAYESYDLIEHKIAKSRWMVDQLRPFGGTVHHIRLGLNLDIFYPHEQRPHEPPFRIVSAARPGVEVRNFGGTLEIMRIVTDRRDDVLPTFFGKPFQTDLFVHEHVGVLDQIKVARLLRDSAVLLDASLEQSFGRPGIEAMACGVPAVLTTRGGINEYARDGFNCLQVEPTDVMANAEAIETLLDDRAVATRLRDGGLATAAEYDADVEAGRTMGLFRELLA